MSAKSMRRKVWLPDSDGQPMADNPLQFQWIVLLKEGCEALLAEREDAFVAGDHLIYPVYPEPGTERQAVRLAPDVYVAFGVPKGYRGSYRVWEEDDVFPQVIFEVWSPSNRAGQMEEKRQSYELYGAEEYYVIYPEAPASVEVWQRQDGELHRVEDATGWVSPRLGIRFEQQGENLRVIQPDGTPFLTFAELIAQRDAERDRAAEEAQLRVASEQRIVLEVRRRAEAEQRAALEAQQRAEAEQCAALEAQQRAEAEQRAALETQQRAEAEQRATAERERAERLAAKLRELGLDPDAR